MFIVCKCIDIVDVDTTMTVGLLVAPVSARPKSRAGTIHGGINDEINLLYVCQIAAEAYQHAPVGSSSMCTVYTISIMKLEIILVL